MTFPIKYRLPILLFLLLFVGRAALADLPVVMEDKDVLPYLEKMIDWHRQAAALDTSPEIPRELIVRDALQQHTAQALDGSFTFARALAEILPVESKPPAVIQDKLDKATKEITLNRAIGLAEQNIEQLQAAQTTAKTRAERDKLAGLLKLTQEHLTLLKAIAQTVGVPDIEDDSLPHKIDQLAGTIAAIDTDQTKTSTDATPAQGSSTSSAAPSASGIVGLASKIYFFTQARSTVKAMLNDTTSLYADNTARSQIIRDAVKNIMEEGKTLGDKPPVAAKPAKPAAKADTAAKTPPVAAAPQPTYDELVTEMKKLSKVAIALSQTNKALTLCTHDLSDWVDLINRHIGALTKNLAFRLWMLGLAIGVALFLSMLASKAIRRYVHDRRRREQLRVIRKITLAVTISTILFLAFFTDLSSLATFAGLVTAGIAFAMKDMILSVIAYFQFFSSSDIRPGDTITIAGVTGKITNIGMLRFYMLEIERSDAGFLPTGRVVGFANNILFQPMPFYRQTPGTDFVWNEIDISLAPTIDHDLAYKKLNDILKTIYAKHQAVIKTSEEALQKVSPFKLEIAAPQTYFRFTNMGIVFVVRYAVDRDLAQTLHFQMTSELIAAVKKDPDLKIQHIS